jgi:hypothetical protein
MCLLASTVIFNATKWIDDDDDGDDIPILQWGTHTIHMYINFLHFFSLFYDIISIVDVIIIIIFMNIIDQKIVLIQKSINFAV